MEDAQEEEEEEEEESYAHKQVRKQKRFFLKNVPWSGTIPDLLFVVVN